jgi:hypothetical protein
VGRADPAVAEDPLVGIGPAVVADAGSGEIDHGLDALERCRVELPDGRVPLDLVGGLRWSPDQAEQVVAFRRERGA